MSPGISAVVLSARPVTLAIAGVEVVPYVSHFDSPAGLLNARIAALEKVETEWFFYLDDDDELPADHERVLAQCMSAGTPLAYTNELITDAQGGSKIRRAEPYSEDRFVKNIALVHHLAVCKTEAAREAAKRIPRGEFAVENLLFFEVAKSGATHIDEVGYIWHKRAGLNRHPRMLFALLNSAAWAHRNRSTPCS